MASLNIDRLLEACIKMGGSDLHITVGRPPVLRISGRLRSLDTKVLEPDDTTALMKSITPERNQQELQEAGGTDYGFAFGDAGRFRTAVFKQKGNIAMVLRLIPSALLSFEQIGLPKVCAALCRRPRGLFLVTGPTGSGKTTTLMMLAGFETPTHGEIFLNEQPIGNIPPHRRNIGMVFQNYALFPHMTVRENLSYPLAVRKLPKHEIKERVARALEMVELKGFEGRFPAQLLV